MSEPKYKVKHFDIRKAIPGFMITITVAYAVTWLNSRVATEWVKAGENFIFFFAVLVAVFLYGFSVGIVFTAGQRAWKEAVRAVEEKNYKEVEKHLGRHPDYIPIVLMLLGATLLSISAVYIHIPDGMRWIMLVTLVVIYSPVIFALDYWGFEDGVAYIEKVE